jgi:glycosyltransferase involved in cell wall biosynthesis
MESLPTVLQAHGLQHLERRLVQEEELTVPLLLMMADLDGALAELDITGDDASRLVRALRTCPQSALAQARASPSPYPATVEPAAPASTASGVPAAGSLRDMRVAVVSHSGYFAGDSYGGATRASLALIREMKRLCGSAGVDILALLPKPCPEGLVYALAPRAIAAVPGGGPSATAPAAGAEGPRLGLHRWEGHDVLIGDMPDLVCALRGREYSVVLSLSIEASLLELACTLSAAARYAMAHNYYLPPFGPFCRHEPQPKHVELLRRMDRILSPCSHHCRYIYRWGPTDPPLKAEPLWAADYHYFHRHETPSAVASDPDSHAACGGAETLRLPPPMRPWQSEHRFVTLVSPCPAKGLSVLLALARRMPKVDFAAVPTGWTDELSRQALGRYPNITVLPPNDDVDLIFRQTRVLLAPSLWQECCPLVVMEALLRAIPCVSSDVLGMPEANRNPELVCETRLCFNHAKGSLIHGLNNAQLELRLGARPPLHDSRHRSAALAASVTEEATDHEVEPFETALRRLLTDGEYLHRQSARCREVFVDFARQCEGGVARLLRAGGVNGAVLNGAGAAAAPESAGGVNGACNGAGGASALTGAGVQLRSSVNGASVNGADAAAVNGAVLVPVATFDLKPHLPSHAESDAAAAALGARALRTPARYRVTFKPLIYLRAAPSTRAAILNVAPAGTLIEADMTVDSAEGRWVRSQRPVMVQPVARRGWALERADRLGELLHLEGEGMYADDLRS